jgi:hypothetical protein
MAAGTGLGLEQPSAQTALLKARIRVSANWFFWIAGLSLVNSIIMEMGGGIRFIVGLGITEFVDALIAKQPTNVHAAGWIINIIVAGVFALFGKLGRDGNKPVFILGMVLYVADALLMANFQIWLGVAFHAYALYRIYQGLAAVNALHTLQQNAPNSAYQV